MSYCLAHDSLRPCRAGNGYGDSCFHVTGSLDGLRAAWDFPNVCSGWTLFEGSQAAAWLVPKAELYLNGGRNMGRLLPASFKKMTAPVSC